MKISFQNVAAFLRYRKKSEELGRINHIQYSEHTQSQKSQNLSIMLLGLQLGEIKKDILFHEHIILQSKQVFHKN